MKIDDVVGIIAFTSLGAWWLIAPQSVVRFYSWFYKRSNRKIEFPKLRVIRIIGLLWMILVICVSIWQTHFKLT